jgi:tetratricopeptide (TPR) repeat protein
MRLRNCILFHVSLAVSLFAFNLGAVGQIERGGAGDWNSGPDTAISGMIVDSADVAMSNVRVELRDVSRGNVVASTWTNIAGQYQITGARRGEYEIVALNGLHEVRQRVSVLGGSTALNLRFHDIRGDAAGNSQANTVDVSAYKVPQNARKALRKAQDALPKGDFQRVAHYVAEALSIYPNYGEALTLNGFLKLQNHEIDDARQDLEKALQYNSGYPMTYFLLAATYNDADRFEDALRTANAGLKLAPNAWQGYFELSKASLAKSQFLESLRQASKALELGATIPVLHLVRGDAFAGLKDYDNAIAEMQSYLTGDPNGAVSVEVRSAIEKLRTLAAKTSTTPVVGSFVSQQH